MKTKTANQPPLDWMQILEFLKPDGQQKIVDFIHECREQRGTQWLPEIKREFPLASWIVELTMTKTPDEAVNEIARLYPLMPVKFFAGEHIRNLHARLKFEIEKKRDL